MSDKFSKILCLQNFVCFIYEYSSPIIELFEDFEKKATTAKKIKLMINLLFR
ncbi:hypothetical cytosolic protein [Syntrophus aciditrophicus SB]|uniref:Hypothetical cytosolic protein n=1 Tax=Syntrophus aciditrophicus (strain SB) TaxID=56780 RepID=Q2LS26_SYNAS|nr:hypothetical cytosolic protein [Syntrophus aciditrophicus SB]